MDDIENSPIRKEYNFLSNVILTKGKISKPFNPKFTTDRPHQEEVIMLWDTGATNTVITKNIAEKLGLKISGNTISHGVNGQFITGRYVITVEISNGVTFPFINVTEGVLNNCDVLIGMDIIQHGDFIISNTNKKTIFKFSIPSTLEI